MRFLFTAEEFGAAEALRTGLVRDVFPAGAHMQRATELAHLIARQAPRGVRATLASTSAGLGHGPNARLYRIAAARHPAAGTEPKACTEGGFHVFLMGQQVVGHGCADEVGVLCGDGVPGEGLQ